MITDDEIEAKARIALGSLYPQLLKAIDQCDGTHLMVDVIRGIADGLYQLFQTDKSVMITQVVTFPRCKAVTVFLCAGDLDDLFTVMMPRLEAFARSVGADRLYGGGRKGWQRSACKIGFRPDRPRIVKHLTREDAP